MEIKFKQIGRNLNVLFGEEKFTIVGSKEELAPIKEMIANYNAMTPKGKDTKVGKTLLSNIKANFKKETIKKEKEAAKKLEEIKVENKKIKKEIKETKKNVKPHKEKESLITKALNKLKGLLGDNKELEVIKQHIEKEENKKEELQQPKIKRGGEW